jgi:hypothetical protein
VLGDDTDYINVKQQYISHIFYIEMDEIAYITSHMYHDPRPITIGKSWDILH